MRNIGGRFVVFQLRSRFVAGAIALMLGAVPSFAQTLTATQPGGRIVTFGDSLSDNGNLFAVTGHTNPPSPPYFNGRFSNGPTWVELLSGGAMNSPFQGTGVAGNTNLAFGGAVSGLGGNPPGVQSQIGAFLGFGGTFGTKDLVTMWGGANDLLNLFAGPPPSQAGIAGTALAAAANMTNNVNSVIVLGGKTVLVPNLPDLGSTPSFSSNGPLAQQGGTFGATTFNSALATGLAGLTGKGANIIQMDVFSLLNVARSNPSAFGLVNTTQACAVQTSPTTFAVCPNPNQFLFWDRVHPTETGHQLLARFALLLINANVVATAVNPLNDVAVAGRLQSSDETFDRISQWAYGANARQNGIYAQVTGSFADEKQHDATSDYRANFGGARFGYDHEVGNSLYGGAFAFSTGSLSGAGAGGTGENADVTSVHGDLYAATLLGPLYLSGQVGGSFQSIDSRRDTGIPTVVASGHTNGFDVSAAGEAGVILKAGAVTFVPSGRAEYVHSSIKGFSESAAVLAMSYSDRTFDGVLASARLKALVRVGLGPMAGLAFGEVGYQQYVSTSNGSLTGALVGNTALPFQIATSDPLARGLNFKVGLEGKVSETATLTLQYGIALQDNDGQTHFGQARVKVPF